MAATEMEDGVTAVFISFRRFVPFFGGEVGQVAIGHEMNGILEGLESARKQGENEQ